MERAEKVAVGPDREEQELLRLLKAALAGYSDREKINSSGQTDNINYEKLFAMAQAHQVLPLLYDVLETAAHEETGEAPETAAHEEVGEAPECMVVWRTVWQQAARRTVSQNYHLLFTGKFLTGLLSEADIPVALLKGTATSAYYPVPELRKSGDVDLYLLKEGDLPKARALFLAHGMTVKEEQHSLHHLVMQTAEGIVVELHTLIAEPFDNAAMNTYLEKCRELFAAHTEEKEIMGVTLPVLTGACHAYELLLHMLQHFLRAGFGLKLLCDWVVFWEKGVSGEEQQLYKKTDSGKRSQRFFRCGNSYLCGISGTAGGKRKLSEKRSEGRYSRSVRQRSPDGRGYSADGIFKGCAGQRRIWQDLGGQDGSGERQRLWRLYARVSTSDASEFPPGREMLFTLAPALVHDTGTVS